MYRKSYYKKHEEKNPEYKVEDSIEEVEKVKKLYQEFDSLHIQLRNNLKSLKNSLEQVLKTIKELRESSNKYYGAACVINNNFKEKTTLEQIPIINWFIEETPEEPKYIKLNSDFSKEFNVAKIIEKKCKQEINQIDDIGNNISNIFKKSRLSNYENLIGHEKTIKAHIEQDEIYDKCGKPRYWVVWGERNHPSFYDHPNKLEHITIPVCNYDSKILKIDEDKISNEFKKYFESQKKILYSDVYVPLMKWKKGANEKLMHKLRIKKHETTNGYIYILTNKAFPKYIKIGSTMKDPKIRADELTGTGLPFPYEVMFKILTKNCEILEKKIHIILDKKRINLEREFFECSIEEAKNIIIEVIKNNAR